MNHIDSTNQFGEFGRLPESKFDETYLRLIKSDIDSAQTFLKKIPENARRGLTLDTLAHFRCGWLTDWVNTRNRAEWICGMRKNADGKPKPLAPPSRRIIVPTPDLEHFNAIIPPADRKAGDDKWCKVHAGKKNKLFYDDKSLKKGEVVVVLEGEIDAMSVWQATNGRAAAVAILGRSNWNNAFVPQLQGRLKGKKFILMFDKDDGQIDSDNLRKSLINMGIPAVSKYFYDFLSDDDKNFFEQKVDANLILQKRGDSFLKTLLEKIYLEARLNLTAVEEEISSHNLFAVSVPTHEQSPNHNPNPDKDEIKKILSYIPAAKLDREKWIIVGMILKRYGFSLDDFKNWSKIDYPEYDAARCEADWNSFWTKDENQGKGHTVATLVMIAKEFGYVQCGKPKNQAPLTDEDKEIDEWQQENGAIDPKLLAKLKSEAQRISNISDFAAAAKDTKTLRFLGAYQYYSCFSDVAEKFFTDYSRARDEAKKRIRAYDKAQNGDQFYFMAKGSSAAVDVQTKPPSDSDIALSNMPAPKALKDSTKPYFTEAKKAHKTYLIQKEADEINAQRRAAEEAYNLNPETTKNNLPDCPINLVLPRGIYFREDGIQIVDFDAPPKNRSVKFACENPIIPVRAFREVTENGAEPKQGKQYEIAIKTENTWVYTIVDAQILTDPRHVTKLAKFSALISSPAFFAKAMTKIIALNERLGHLKSIRVFTQPGWHGDEFIYPTGGDDYIVKRGSFDYKNVYKPRGDKKKWLKLIRRAIFHDPNHYDAKRYITTDSTGNETLITPENNTCNISTTPNVVFGFVLGFVAGAPLVRLLGIRNPQAVLGFDSGHGKTAAASLALSFYSRVVNGALLNMNSTINFLDGMSPYFNDVPHVVDELQAADKRKRDNMDEFVHNFAMGVTRGRANVTGEAVTTDNFRGCRLFTGEQTITGDNSGQGAISRVLEIVNDNLFANDFSIEIHKFVEDNYGFFGQDFATKFIPENRERILDYFHKQEEYFGNDVNDLLSSHATILAYAFTGLRFTLEFLEFSNLEEIMLEFLAEAQKLIADAPTKAGASNVNRALPALLDYFDKFPKNFIREIKTNGTKEFVAAEGNATFGVKLLDGSCAVIPSVLHKIIHEDLNLPNSKAIIRALGKKGYLDYGKAKKQDFKKRLSEEFNDFYGKTAWFYVFKPADFLMELIAA